MRPPSFLHRSIALHITISHNILHHLHLHNCVCIQRQESFFEDSVPFVNIYFSLLSHVFEENTTLHIIIYPNLKN